MPEQKKLRRCRAESQEYTLGYPKTDVTLIGWIPARQRSIEIITPRQLFAFRINFQIKHSGAPRYKYCSTACLVWNGILIAKYLEHGSSQSIDFASHN
ncbi:MAG TPA: hypothetical protein VGC66_14535 [Pyrinomonadaceae bacterium]|jgi:hypothetical protein